MPTIELIRDTATNEVGLRLKGTDAVYMYGAGGPLTFCDANEALDYAHEYAAFKGWDVDDTIPPAAL